MLKKILPAVTGAIGFAIGGPMGASIGAGLGSAIRGDNPANIATNALMGYGLGKFAPSIGLVGGQGLGALGTSAQSAFFGAPAQVLPSGTAPTTTRGLAQAMEAGAKQQAQTSAVQKSLARKALDFAKENKLLTGALGLGALQGLGAFKEEEDLSAGIPPSPEPGSQGMLDVSAPSAVYYDPTTRAYGAASPQIPEIYRAKDGGDIKNFPRKVGKIDGPGTEKSDDIPAMLSDGEFVMTAQAVRGLGALNGADKDDKLEQRRKGAKMMYEMMDKFESKVA
jgi:hypothetical protein